MNFYDGVWSTSLKEQWDTHSGPDSLYFKNSIGLHSTSIYFNEKGDYVNRDYNLDLNNNWIFESKEETFNKFLSFFNKYDEMEYYGNKWYTSDFCFTVYVSKDNDEIYVNKHTARGNDRYQQPMNVSIKKPKSVEVVSNEHIKDYLRSLVNLESLKEPFIEKWLTKKK